MSGGSSLTQPNMYVRGILFGKMKFELGDHSYVKCEALDLIADIEFKVKGYIMGGYDCIGGYIKRESTGENLYEISGKWNREMYIKNLAVRLKATGLCIILMFDRRESGDYCSMQLMPKIPPQMSGPYQNKRR